MRRLWIGGLALGLAACATSARQEEVAEPDAAPASVGADVLDSAGRTLARATITQSGDGLRLRIEASGMNPGAYGAHIHAIGRCNQPGFSSAGSHWNPTGRQHGKDNPAGMHKGDLPNLLVGADGGGSFEIDIPHARISGAADVLLDSDGASVVIHAAPDDFRTDPSGNSGARIACGVLG